MDLVEVLRREHPVEVLVDPADPLVRAVSEALAVGHVYLSFSFFLSPVTLDVSKPRSAA